MRGRWQANSAGKLNRCENGQSRCLLQATAGFQNWQLFVGNALLPWAVVWDQRVTSHRWAESQQIEVTFRHCQRGLSRRAGTEQRRIVLPALWLTQLSVGLVCFRDLGLWFWKISAAMPGGIKKNKPASSLIYVFRWKYSAKFGREQFLPKASASSSQQWGRQSTTESWAVGSDAEKETATGCHHTDLQVPPKVHPAGVLQRCCLKSPCLRWLCPPRQKPAAEQLPSVERTCWDSAFRNPPRMTYINSLFLSLCGGSKDAAMGCPC